MYLLYEIVVDFLVDLGLARLFDEGSQRTPWIAVFLSFVVTCSLVVLVLFHGSFDSWVVWLAVASMLILSAVAWLDFQYWQQEREKTKEDKLKQG